MANQIAGTQVELNLTLQDALAAAEDLSSATKLTWRLTRAYSVPGVAVKDDDTVGGVAFTNPPGDGTTGLVTVTLSPTDTEDLQGTYYHEVKGDWGAGNEKTWRLGTIVFDESSVGAD
jgi:hypothetical protein